MTEEEKAFDKVKKGVKEVVGGTAGVVEGTAQGIKEAVEDSKEREKDTPEGVEENAREADSDSSSSYEGRERSEYDLKEGKEPMNPEDIASHEPTAVIRDQGTGISDEGPAGTNAEEAREKYRKKGMTEV